MNPVELSREDIQHIRELVNLNRLGNFAERTGARMALRNYLLNGADYTRMDALVDAALRGMESQGVTMILPDVIGILPMLKGLATLGDFDDLNYDGRPINDELASAIGTLTELEELCARAQPRGEKP